MAHKNKIGFYAEYDKMSGSFTGMTKIMGSASVYNASKDSNIIFWDLITDDPRLIDKGELFCKGHFADKIPKKSPNWDDETAKSVDSEHYLCDTCCEHFLKEEMDYIADEEDEPGTCSVCKNCA